MYTFTISDDIAVEMMGMVGSMNLILITECPKCKYRQKTTTIYRVKCYNCSSQYTVMPFTSKTHHKLRNKSRIVKVIKGNITKEYYKYKTKRLLSRP